MSARHSCRWQPRLLALRQNLPPHLRLHPHPLRLLPRPTRRSNGAHIASRRPAVTGAHSRRGGGAPAAPLSIVAAFEPFDGRDLNRSLEILRKLDADAASGKLPGVETAVLPVDFARLPASVAELTARRPRALLLMGEAARDRVCIEQLALNIADSDTADNAGRIMRAERLVESGVLALHADWDARALAEKLNAAGIPAAASFHAGTYACNAALYLSLHGLAGTGCRVGFLHVPRKGLKMAMLVRAARACLQALQQ